MQSPRASLLLICCCSSILLFACTETTQTEQPLPCVPEAVQVRNSAGECTWTTSCDAADDAVICQQGLTCEELSAEACDLDARCQLESVGVCPGCAPGTDPDLCQCSTTEYCTTKPSDTCADLPEADCLTQAGCSPTYGWTDGGGGTEPAPPGDGGADWAPLEPSWGFLGCVDRPSDPCEGLTVDACDANPACQSVWGGASCLCEPGTNCACPDVEEFIGCISRPVEGCSDFTTPEVCDGTNGCHWEYITDGGSDCLCAPGEPCACDPIAPAPEVGVCVVDSVEDCWGYNDSDLCLGNGCEWVGEGGGEAPCLCEPGTDCKDCFGPIGYCQPPGPTGCTSWYDELSCQSDPDCDWFTDGGVCDCRPGEPCACDPIVAGWCGPSEEPRSCQDIYDPRLCSEYPDCAWLEDGGMRPIPPPPCDCAPDDPNCGCTEPFPGGICVDRPTVACDFQDAFSCDSTPECMWTERGCEPRLDPPQTCESFDQATCENANGCFWNDGGMGAPCFCDPMDPGCDCLVISCEANSRLDANGVCIGESGTVQPEFCCDPAPAGFCESVSPTPTP